MSFSWLYSFTGSFGYELAIDANLSNVFFGLYSKSKHFGQTKSGYVSAKALDSLKPADATEL